MPEPPPPPPPPPVPVLKVPVAKTGTGITGTTTVQSTVALAGQVPVGVHFTTVLPLLQDVVTGSEPGGFPNKMVVRVGSTALLKVNVMVAETDTPDAPFAGSLVIV